MLLQPLQLMMTVVVVVATTAPPIRIGVITGNVPPLYLGGTDEWHVLYQRHVAKIGGVLGRSVQFEIVNLGNVTATGSLVTQATTHLLNSKVDFVICPPGDTTVFCARASQAKNVIAIAPASPNDHIFTCMKSELATQAPECTQPNTRRFPMLFGVMAPASNYFHNYINIVHMRGAKTVTIVVQSQVEFLRMVALGATQSANARGMILQIIELNNIESTVNVDDDIIANATDAIIRYDSDILCLATQNCHQMLSIFHERNYFPRGIVAITCAEVGGELVSGDRLKYVSSPIQWDARMSGPEVLEDETNPTEFFASNTTAGEIPAPKMFHQQWSSIHGLVPNYGAASMMAALQFLEGSILLVNSTETKAVLQQMSQYISPSFYGYLAMSRFGNNIFKSMIMIQRDHENIPQIIAPSIYSTMDFIYPIPSWNERLYVPKMFVTRQELSISAIAVASVIFIGAMITQAISKRSIVTVKSAGIATVTMTMLGSCISIMGVFLWGIENNSTTCTLRPWIWSIGIVVFIAPIIASNYRIYRIFCGQKIQIVHHSNSTMTIHSLTLILPVIIANIVCQFFNPYQPFVVVYDPLRPVFNVTVCQSSTNTFFVVVCTYSVLLVLVSCWLAAHVRKAYSQFRETKMVMMAVYTWSTAYISILCLQFGETRSNFKSMFIVRSILVIFANVISTLIIILPRIYPTLFQGEPDKVSPEIAASKITLHRRVMTLQLDKPATLKLYDSRSSIINGDCKRYKLSIVVPVHSS